MGLYLNPPDKAVVLSVDEKTQVQALERTQPMLPLGLGPVARHTHDYKRNGVVDLYAALEVATGRVVHRVTESHTGEDFLAFRKQVARAFPDVDPHVIIDNFSTHTTPAVMTWLAANPRVTFHFTPTSASWPNQVQGLFGILTRPFTPGNKRPEQVGPAASHHRFSRRLEPQPPLPSSGPNPPRPSSGTTAGCLRAFRERKHKAA